MGHRISIVIPTLNEEKCIGRLLDDIQAQTFQPSEVFVVDGGSKDKTKDIVRKYKNVRLIHEKKQVAHQRDRGARETNGNLLIFLDADTRIKPYFLQRVDHLLTDKKTNIACPIYVPIEKHLSSLVLYSIFNSIFIAVQKVMPCGAGSCIIVRRKAYFRVSGFDKRYKFDDMHFLSKFRNSGDFKTIPLAVHVSSRRIKNLGFFSAMYLYCKLSWYFMKNDYAGANAIPYPFGNYN